MNRKAFTLIEAIVVLAIITVFLALSTPFFSRFAESTKLQGSTRSITSALRTARGYAISKSVDYYTVFDTDAEPDEYYIYDGTDFVDKKYKLPTGIWFCRPDGGDVIDDAIEFTKTVNIGVDTYKAALFKPTGELNEEAANTLVYISDGKTDAAKNTMTISVEKTTGRAKID